MNKKKLPKAIRRTTEDVDEPTAVPVDAEWPADPTTATLASRSADNALAPTLRTDGSAAVSLSSERGALVRIPVERNSVRRRSRALAIVERHATYSAAGGIIPLPIANVASVTAIIVRMVKVLSELYEVPFARDRTRAVVVALAGGAMPTGLAAAASSTIYYLTPVSAVIGLAVSSVAAVACTRNIGRVFVEHFESGATLEDISVPQRK